MKIKRIYGVIGLSCILLLAGCNSSQSAEEYQKVGESVKEETSEKEIKNDEETLAEVTDEIIDESLTYYLADSHFYESGPQPYVIEGGEMGEEAVSVNVEILEAFGTKDIKKGGDYFVNSTQMNTLKEIAKKNSSEDNSYLFMKVRLTNPTREDLTMCMYGLQLYKRILGDLGAKYGFAEQCIASVSGGLDYDKAVSNGKNFYFVKIKAGESLDTTIAYYIPTDALKEKLYIQCFEVLNIGFHNIKTKRWEPSNNENVRFLRVNVKE